jgi:hypothetical protein
MIVVIAGMMRSASTLSFNIAREVLERRGGVQIYTCNSLDGIDLSLREHTIIKSHAPDQNLSDMICAGKVKCICTYRKPEDAIASWMEVFGFSLDESLASFEIWLEWHNKIKLHCLNMHNSRFDYYFYSAVMEITKYLTNSFDRLEAIILTFKFNKFLTRFRVNNLKKSSSVDIGFSYYDPETFFHRGHVRSIRSLSARHYLEDGELLRIRKKLGRFLNSDGSYQP